MTRARPLPSAHPSQARASVPPVPKIRVAHLKAVFSSGTDAVFPQGSRWAASLTRSGPIYLMRYGGRRSLRHVSVASGGYGEYAIASIMDAQAYETVSWSDRWPPCPE